MNSPTLSRLGIVLLSLLLALTTLTLAPTGATGTTGTTSKHCRVKNVTQDTWFATDSGLALTRALEATQPGDRLNVFGTCRGSFEVPVDLTIAGSKSVVSPTTLRGDGSTNRILDTVPDTAVRLVRLRIAGGSNGGLQVTEGAAVTLLRSRVTGNSTSNRAGGGILNGGDLTIGSSWISDNRAAAEGGGIFNYGNLWVNDSIISRNVATGGGGGLFNEGFAELNGSRVRLNTAAFGGGILSVNGLVLNQTVVSDNVPNDCPC
jgi:hypothetical protein